jgi:MFS family permease
MVLIGFVINAALWTVSQPFVPNASVAATYLRVSVSEIHWLSYAWSVAAALGMLPGLWLVENIGLRKVATCCVSTMVLGVSLRCAMYSYTSGPERVKESVIPYIWILLGNVVAAVGAVPIQASTTLIAATWFADDKRGLANTLVRSMLHLSDCEPQKYIIKFISHISVLSDGGLGFAILFSVHL